MSLGSLIRLGCGIFILGLAIAQNTPAQVVPAGDQGGLMLSVGVAASGYTFTYGDQKLLGFSAFLDADTRRHLGLEAEMRRLEFHNTDDITATTWLGGARYFRDVGPFQIYGKGLVGFAHANLAYGLGQANSLAIAPGGGVDLPLKRRIHLRLADFEYQIWPQAVYGSAPAFKSIGISSGIRIRVF